MRQISLTARLVSITRGMMGPALPADLWLNRGKSGFRRLHPRGAARARRKDNHDVSITGLSGEVVGIVERGTDMRWRCATLGARVPGPRL